MLTEKLIVTGIKASMVIVPIAAGGAVITPLIFVSAPQLYNKKPVKIGQGLDFLKVWQGKSKKTIGKNMENEETTLKLKEFRV